MDGSFRSLRVPLRRTVGEPDPAVGTESFSASFGAGRRVGYQRRGACLAGRPFACVNLLRFLFNPRPCRADDEASPPFH
jgi:hypothetical protein